MANIYDKCKICKHSKFDKSCGIMCGLTNSKPDTNKVCQEFETDQKAVDVNVYTRQNKGLSKKASLAITIATGIMFICLALLKVGVKADRITSKRTNKFTTPKYEKRLDKLIEANNKQDIDGIIEFGKWYNSLPSEGQALVKENAKKEIVFE